jgi:hypothetical protein
MLAAVGNPNAVSRCSSAQLASDSCPAASRDRDGIGDRAGTGSAVAGHRPGDVYDVTPTGPEPARIGMVVRPVGGVLGRFSTSGPVTLRIPGDFGLVTTFDNLPRTLPPVTLPGQELPRR